MIGYTTYTILRILFGARRAADMRLRARHRRVWTGKVTKDVICTAICFGILLGAVLHGLTTDYDGSDMVHKAEAATTTPVAREVRIEVAIDWTRGRIEKEIRDTFPEDPETAVKIARCESGLKADIQSRHVLHYGPERSFGIFQIHEPDWGKLAVKLGYSDYKTDPADNIAMARYIYDNAGKRWTDWSCYNKKMI
jgi:hypothetical protein